MIENFDGAGDQIPSTKKTLHVNATAAAVAIQLEVYQQNIMFRNALTSGNDANTTVYMPNVTEARGRVYTFNCIEQAGDGKLIVATWGANQVAAADEVEDWDGDFELVADDDHLTLYSNGTTWIALNNSIA